MQDNSTLRRYVRDTISRLITGMTHHIDWVQKQLGIFLADAGVSDFSNATMVSDGIDARIQGYPFTYSLQAASDVNIANPTEGQIIGYVGGIWKNVASPAGNVDALRREVMSNRALDAIRESMGMQTIYGRADVYNTIDTIDTANASGYIHGTRIDPISSAEMWTGAVEGFSFTDDNIINTVNDRHLYTSESIVGAASLEFNWHDLSAPSGSHQIAIVDSSAMASFNPTNVSVNQCAGVAANACMVRINVADGVLSVLANNSAGTTEASSPGTAADGDLIKLERAADNSVNLYLNGSLIYTFTATRTGEIRFIVSAGAGANTFELNNVRVQMSGTGEALGPYITNAQKVVNVSASSAQWDSDGIANFTWSGDDVINSVAGRSMRLLNTFDGDFELHITIPSSEAYFGIYDAAEDATFTSAVGSYTVLQSFTKSWYVSPPISSQNGVWYDTTEVVASAPAHNTPMILKRVGDTISLYANNVLYHTWTQTFAGPVRFMISASANGTYRDLRWIESGPAADFIVPSTEFVANATPQAGYAVGFIKPIDAVTYGTDVLFDMSRDGGLTWDACTITYAGTVDLIVNGSAVEADIIYGVIDQFTGGVDTDCRYRWRSANSKEVRLYTTTTEFSI